MNGPAEKIFNNRYRVDGPLGTGELALVYRGTDTLLRRRIALKVLREQFASDDDFVQRISYEAQSAAKLSHPNIVNVYDFGREGHSFYIVMELVDGATLGELMRQERIVSEPVALGFAIQIANGLAYAHRNGVLHRDVKPTNILITKDGAVKLSDFGIARAVSDLTLGVTQPGMAMGSVAYISPEQAKGHDIDERSDLYSVGVVLYQMLTGALPFSGDTPVAVALKHISEDARAIDPATTGVSPAVASIVGRLLRKNPQERFSSATELFGALREAPERPHSVLDAGAPTLNIPVVSPTPPEHSVAPDRAPANRAAAYASADDDDDVVERVPIDSDPRWYRNPMDRHYENFDLEVSRAANGYVACVVRSPGGEGSHPFVNPVTNDDIELLFYQVLAARKIRSLASKPGTRLRRVGAALFNALFAGEVLSCYVRSQAMCSEDSGLRIRLRFADTPELVNLPWELLYDDGFDRWVALTLDTPLVRYLRLPQHIRPLRVTGPLRVLAVASNPSDVNPLDTEGELRAVEAAFNSLEEAEPGTVVFETLRHPTPELLNRKLMAQPWHVLHFIGHGVFDRDRRSGSLVFEDAQGKARLISAERFAVMLQGRALKLVVLNSCEGAKVADDDAGAGVAQSLITQGVPSVVAMQFPITDVAALAFSRTFYYALALGTSLDRAVVEARRAIFQESELEWATPSLYLRSHDGVLFETSARPRL